MLRDSYPYYLANRAAMPNTDLEVFDKYSGEVATRVAMADSDAIDAAIAAADVATEPMRKGVSAITGLLSLTSAMPAAR